MPEAFTTARRWAELDADPRTRSELNDLVDSAEAGDEQAVASVESLFSGRLAFGTAGLRAALGPGPLRMNRLVVSQTAVGLLTYAQNQFTLASQQGIEVPDSPVIVIGYDARHQSDEFAFITAEIFLAAGWAVHLFDSCGPTPLLARQVTVQDASVGVMVTASHNPPQDNGYKVYLGGPLSRFLEPSGLGAGAQIVSPVDKAIAATIAETVAADFAVGSSAPAVEPKASLSRPSGVKLIDVTARSSYQSEALELLDPQKYPHRDLTVVYTAMHGVGGAMVTDLLAAAGFQRVIPVSKQFEPDPDFPTVGFPNPEEQGALDLALQAAAAHDADVVLANDPDADRLSAAAFDEHAGAWRQLSGDEIGALLGWHLLERGPLRTGWQNSESSDYALGNSVVSSRLLGKLCEARGVNHSETLTGFKWLARVPNIVFGYEEAIGYAVDPSHVRDKDGISAALILSELFADLKAKGISAFQALDEIAAEAGVFVTGQLTIKVADLSQLGYITSALRDNPPAHIAGSPVVNALDLSHQPLPGQEFSPNTATDALIYLTERGDRVIVRPSGTEPKVKCYLEAVAPTADTADAAAIATAREEASTQLVLLREAMNTLIGKDS